jgi:hypothetical protein
LKKLIAIILLAIYLFNLGGYLLAFGLLINQSDDRFIARIDKNNYDDTHLVQIVIPLNLPYMQNTGGFERVDGSVEKEGVKYSYVKRRIYNDSLYILCLPNNERTSLVNQRTKYSAGVNDFEIAKKAKKSSAKNLVNAAEYNYTNIAQYICFLPGTPALKQSTYFTVHLISMAADTPDRPPQAS